MQCQPANDTKKQTDRCPPKQQGNHESYGSLKELLEAHSETARWPPPKQNPAKTAAPDSPHPLVEMETASENENDVLNRQEKQTHPWKTS